MVDRTLSQIRTSLATMDTGANRRLLYPACGDDVGCSVGLFWPVCDSFYLVDPHFGKGIDIQGTLAAMAAGTANYMQGLRIRSDEGRRKTFDGVPGTLYQVWLDAQPAHKKRLCFIDSTTENWLKSTTTRYNVIISKDYDGITGDSDFPYVTVWDRLNSNGIFAETIGDARTSVEFDFIKYRCRGFVPLCKALTDANQTIGFANGLHLFQKRCHFHTSEYSAVDASIKVVTDAVNALLADFVLSTIASVAADMENSLSVRTRAQELGQQMVLANITTWAAAEGNDAFLSWMYKHLRRDYPAAINAIDRLNPAKGVGFTKTFLGASLKPLRLNTWGTA